MERRQLATAAAEYPHLRGLFAIPMGLVMIASGLGNLEWGPFRELWAFPVFVLIAGLTCLPIIRFYKQNYGQVTLAKKAQIRAAISVALCVPLIFAGSTLDYKTDLPIWGFLAAWALLMLISYGFSVGLKPHHMAVGGTLLVASLIPVWGGLEPGLRSNYGLIVAGIAVMVAGIFDHLLLVRTFGSLENLSVGNGVN